MYKAKTRFRNQNTCASAALIAGEPKEKENLLMLN